MDAGGAGLPFQVVRPWDTQLPVTAFMQYYHGLAGAVKGFSPFFLGPGPAGPLTEKKGQASTVVEARPNSVVSNVWCYFLRRIRASRPRPPSRKTPGSGIQPMQHMSKLSMYHAWSYVPSRGVPSLPASIWKS